MNFKQLIWIGMIVGSTIGGFIPSLWGGGMFSAVIGSTIGGLLGIFGALKLSGR